MTKEQMEEINKTLESYGESAVQHFESTSGFLATGYRPQCVIDAVNNVIGPMAWKHNIVNLTVETTTLQSGKDTSVAVAEVTVQLLNDQGQVTFETGPQFGGSRVISGGVADAKKGAITDAIGKAFSLMSVGNLAYRGDLAKKYPKDKDTPTSQMSSERFKPVSTSTSKTTTATFKPFNKPVTTNVALNAPKVEATQTEVLDTTKQSNLPRPAPKTGGFNNFVKKTS